MIEVTILVVVTVRVRIPIRDNGVDDGNNTEEVVVGDAEKTRRAHLRRLTATGAEESCRSLIGSANPNLIDSGNGKRYH